MCVSGGGEGSDPYATISTTCMLIGLYCVFFTGLQLGVGQRLLSDTGSSVQAHRINCELLHSSTRDDTHVHVDRPAFGREEAKPADGHHAQFESK